MKRIAPAGGVSEVVTAAHSLALNWARKRVDSDTAQDVAQEVAIAVWQDRLPDPSIFVRRAELKRFVPVAARNALICHVRSENRRPRPAEVVLPPRREHPRPRHRPP